MTDLRKVISELFMFPASLSRSPPAPVLAILSLPARSTSASWLAQTRLCSCMVSGTASTVTWTHGTTCTLPEMPDIPAADPRPVGLGALEPIWCWRYCEIDSTRRSVECERFFVFLDLENKPKRDLGLAIFGSEFVWGLKFQLVATL